MYALIDRWRNIDETQQAICKEAGISFQTFRYWLKKQNARRDLFKETGRFIPVKIDPTSHFEELQIQYPNGVKISCPGSISANQIKELIKLF